MSKKINISPDQSASKVQKRSVFNRIINEIDLTEIPAKYVESVLVQYMDGSILDIKGDDITHSVNMKRYVPRGNPEYASKQTKDIKVFINITLLEQDVDELVEQLIDNRC